MKVLRYEPFNMKEYSTSDLNQILRQNCFEVFDLPPKYNIDRNNLDNKYKNLQKLLHPDNFINHPDSLLSVMVSAHINDAYTTLSSPLLKTLALLKQNGITLDLNKDKALPADFLMGQMEAYEEIDAAANSLSELNQIKQMLISKTCELNDKISQSFMKNNFTMIIEDTKKLAFYNKLEQLIDQKTENLW